MYAKKCRICSSKRVAAIRRLKDSHFLVQCKKCGIIFQDPFPDKNSVHKQYEGDDLKNTRYYESNRLNDLISFEKRWRIIERNIRKKPKKVLDYGCSTGNFIEASKNLGYNVMGKELNKKSIKICRDKGFDVGATVRGKNFDLVHAGDLIEHVTSPEEFLKEIKKTLHVHGYIVMSTPDFGNWLAHKIQIKIDEHLYYFTKKSMKKLLERNGFKAVYIGPFSRKRSIKNLVYSSTSRIGSINVFLKIFNALRVHRIVDAVISNLRDDMLVIAEKKNQ